MIIRRAEQKDIDGILKLLRQVLEIHAKIRPDLFVSGTTKYSEEQLKEMFLDDARPVFVAAGESDEVLGYAFCVFQEQPATPYMNQFKTLYIDDLCVDQNVRGQHIGKSLFEYVKGFAKEAGCYDITLNVWTGNDSARTFYENLGMFAKETQMEFIL